MRSVVIVTHFALSKWYLDVVSEGGVAFIGYAARLRWGTLRVHYASTLLAPLDRTKPEARTTLREGAGPLEQNQEVTWRHDSLDLRGVWQALDEPITQSLYSCAEGSVTWDCRMPRARARVEIGDAVIEGLGYVERLDLTLEPWRMPIRELRWGRALGEAEGLVWVDWQGDVERPHEVQLVQLGGKRLEPSVIDDGGISVDRMHIVRFEKGRSLRSGLLGLNVFSSLPLPIRRLLPKFIAEMHEIKTLCRARLGEKSAWCIHEVVGFP